MYVLKATTPDSFASAVTDFPTKIMKLLLSPTNKNALRDINTTYEGVIERKFKAVKTKSTKVLYFSKNYQWFKTS